MKKWLVGIIGASIFGAAPVVPEGNGIISWAEFEDAQGRVAYMQISDEQYARMGLPTGESTGFNANPKKDGYTFKVAKQGRHDAQFGNEEYSERISSSSMETRLLSRPKDPGRPIFNDIDDWVTPLEAITPEASAAIAFDAAAGSSDNGGVVTSLTFAHTVAGTDRLIVGVQSILPTDGSTVTMTSMVYNGDALTEVDEVSVSDGSTRARMAIYVLANPDTGTNNMVATVSGAVDGTKQFAASSMSYTGANQTGQPDSNGSQSGANDGTDPYVVTTTVVVGDSWLVGGFVGNQGDFPAGVGGTGTVQRDADRFNQVVADSDGVRAAGSQNLQWDRSGSGDANSESVALVISIDPAAVAAGATFDDTTFEIIN